jgi:radical SAM superfamily enzyme YgiQ (UPF0313 family)
VKILLISAYDLGRQPFGLASPAAWLRGDGHQVQSVDLSLEPFPLEAARAADLAAFHLPMHTATRLAAPVIERLRDLNPSMHIACYGLYAPLNEALLRNLGVRTIVGGEFEPALLDLARRLARGEDGPAPALIALERIKFLPPDRRGLPALDRYAALVDQGGRRTTGYTEASRGCKHLCRHCPIVPVYRGTFRIVPAGIVLDDVRAQVEAGARHITFGDPDFFNGPAHAMRIVEELHREFPEVSYDATIKIEHLLARRDLLPELARTGCAFVTSAVESIDDAVLAKLEKGHTRADFIEVARGFRDAGLALSPTFIPFTPWTTRTGYRELLRAIVDLELVDNVAPVQLALRLLITSGSRLLDLDEIRAIAGPFDPALLIHPWRHEDPEIDSLPERLMRLIAAEQKRGASRREIFARIWREAHGDASPDPMLPARATIPYLTEPWYC